MAGHVTTQLSADAMIELSVGSGPEALDSVGFVGVGWCLPAKQHQQGELVEVLGFGGRASEDA